MKLKDTFELICYRLQRIIGSVFIKTNVQFKMMNTLMGLRHAILGNFV